MSISVYEVEVEWGGGTRTIEADASDIDPLIGMERLYGYKLTVEAVVGGAVAIEKL